MVSVAVGDGSAPSWESHHDLRHHYQTFFDGYDRQRGVEVTQKYVRRGKEAESVEAAAAQPEPPKLCVLCRASETPLWRKGPSGPKSLCNACGIRYKRKTAVGSNGGGDGPKKLNSDRAAGKPLWVSSEELKQKQKEKQKRMLLALMQRQRQWNARRRRTGRRPEAVAEGGVWDEAEEAALLLLSLSSGNFVR